MGYQKTVLIGNVGKDPEIKLFENDNQVVTFSLAVNSSYVKKSTGEKVEETEWFNCEAWGKLAGVIAKHVTKGMELFVEGSHRTKSYEAEGGKRYFTNLVVSEFRFTGKKEGAKSTDSGTEEEGYPEGWD